MTWKTGLIAWVVALPALGADTGTPGVEGLYRAPELGVLAFSMRDGWASGKYVGEGACPFEPGQQIVEGRLEGGVLVGSVMLCQTGAACEQKVYPFLGFVDRTRGRVVGDVKLDAGCSSPGLKGRRLSLQALAEPKGRSAASIAQLKADPQKATKLYQQALFEGSRLFERGEYDGAVQKFELAISHLDTGFLAYEGLGVAELKRGNRVRAFESLRRALSLAEEPTDQAEVRYNLACAYSVVGNKAAALAELQQAVRLGFSEADRMNADADLTRLLHDEPEFRRLVEAAREPKKKNSKSRL